METTTATLIRIQAIFWFSAFVLRPLYLASVEPGRGQLLVDYRLIALGYDSTLVKLLNIVLICQIGFVLTQLAWISIIKSKTNILNMAGNDRLISVIIVFVLVGWVGRISQLAGYLSISRALVAFAAVGCCLAIVYLRPATRTGYYGIAVVSLSEVSWALLSASKTPILAITTAYVIRFMYTLTKQQKRKALPALLVLVAITFSVIQPLKGISTEAIVAENNSGPFARAEGIGISIIQRTDMLSSVTDGYLFTEKPWISTDDYIQDLLLAAIPKGPYLPYENQGIRWTREVRSDTFSNQYQDVSLASGPIAEGLAQGGVWNALIRMAILMMITTLVGRGLLSKSLPVVIFAATIAFDSSLYESGILGNAESLAKAFQLTLVGVLVSELFGSRSKIAPQQLEQARI